MIGIDDLLKTLFQDVADAGRDTTPGELVRSSLAGQMPSGGPSGGGMSLPMALGGPRGLPRVPGPPPVPGPSLPSARSSAAPVQVAQAPNIPGNALTDFSQGYSSGGLIGAIGNLMQGPETRAAMAQQYQRQQAEAQAQQNMTINAIRARYKDMPPEMAAVIARDSKLLQEYLGPQDPTKGLTNDQKEWRAEFESGAYKGSFYDWQKEMKKLGAPQTTIDMTGDTAKSKKLAEDAVAQLGEMQKGARIVMNQVDQLNVMQQALDLYNKGATFGSGVLANYEIPMRNFLRSFGIGNADTLKGGELARSVQNQMALLVRNPESGMGMPGALSNADRTFLTDTMPGIDKSPQGNILMIEAAKMAAKRKMEVAALAEQWFQEKPNMLGFQTWLNKWAEENPLYDEAFTARVKAAKEQAKAQQAPQATAPQRRKWNPATGELE